MGVVFFASIVRIAIEFDDLFCLDAGEVGEIRADGMLASPVKTYNAMRTKQLPEAGFVDRLVTAQFASTNDFARFSGEYVRRPLPNPPPQAGEGILLIASTQNFETRIYLVPSPVYGGG